MRKPHHTPAPWTVVAETGPSGTVYRILHAAGRYHGGQESKREVTANRTLIEAATLMLDALQWQEMAEADPHAARRKGYYDRARELRRAAIAKATAETPTEGGES